MSNVPGNKILRFVYVRATTGFVLSVVSRLWFHFLQKTKHARQGLPRKGWRMVKSEPRRRDRRLKVRDRDLNDLEKTEPETSRII